MDFLLGGTSAMAACFFSNPFEVVRTRMQLQGELQAHHERVIHYKNVFHAVYVIAKLEGIFALQKGLSAGLCVQLLLNGIRLGAYQYLDRTGIMRDEYGEIQFYKSIIGASVVGGASSCVSNPLILVKTQLQNQSKKSIAVGQQHDHTGLLDAIKYLHNKHGFNGLRQGIHVNILRGCIGSPAQLSTFAYTKELLIRHEILPDNPTLVVLLSSLLGGVCVSLVMNPFDLINTRLFNQKIDKDGRGTKYNGIVDCVRKIWRKEGFRGFYKGLSINYLRHSVHTVFCFVFWEKLKMYFGQNIKTDKKNK